MDNKEFEKYVELAVDGIPKEFKDKLENVVVTIADFPSSDQYRVLVNRGERGLLLGLYEGIPKTKRGSYGVGSVVPDRITIFKYPILRISESLESAIINIRETVIHEVAHHFGMSDHEIYKSRNR